LSDDNGGATDSDATEIGSPIGEENKTPESIKTPPLKVVKLQTFPVLLLSACNSSHLKKTEIYFDEHQLIWVFRAGSDR
jgi:hypothetical protein